MSIVRLQKRYALRSQRRSRRSPPQHACGPGNAATLPQRDPEILSRFHPLPRYLGRPLQHYSRRRTGLGAPQSRIEKLVPSTQAALEYLRADKGTSKPSCYLPRLEIWASQTDTKFLGSTDDGARRTCIAVSLRCADLLEANNIGLWYFFSLVPRAALTNNE